MTEASEILVMGVGNEMRCDDRVGLVLARWLRAMPRSDVRIVEAGGDITTWYALWSGVDTVLLLDAVSTGAPAGTLHVCRLATDAATLLQHASSHSLGLDAFLGLARVMGCLPRRLIVVGIEGADFGYGTALSAPVLAALPAARAAIHALLAELNQPLATAGVPHIAALPTYSRAVLQ